MSFFFLETSHVSSLKRRRFSRPGNWLPQKIVCFKVHLFNYPFKACCGWWCLFSTKLFVSWPLNGSVVQQKTAFSEVYLLSYLQTCLVWFQTSCWVLMEPLIWHCYILYVHVYLYIYIPLNGAVLVGQEIDCHLKLHFLRCISWIIHFRPVVVDDIHFSRNLLCLDP